MTDGRHENFNINTYRVGRYRLKLKGYKFNSIHLYIKSKYIGKTLK